MAGIILAMSGEPPGGGDSDGRRMGARTRLLGDRGDRPARGDKDVGRAETIRPVSGVAPIARELEPGDDVGGYRIGQVIGQGGMGTVYGAVHALIGKRAAIKVLRREVGRSAGAIERVGQGGRAV